VPVTTIEILGVPVPRLDRRQALDEIVRLYEQPEAARVFYVNAHTLNLTASDPGYRNALLAADLILNDGAGLSIAARIRGDRFPANLNGTDLNPLILELAADRGWPVFLLGAAAGVAARVAELAGERWPSLQIAGTASGYFDDPREMAETIRRAGTGLLMVAMGNPLQEMFLTDHLEATGARLGIGVGAFFDFTAGVVPRAPAWMIRFGVEWIYRLKLEPRRMWRRYIVGNPVFLVRVISERVRGR
jgi:N-acetylglucosaminyldiphosphoundecaprenol N-acetyl-beta-D-mannosaminyltransferase